MNDEEINKLEDYLRSLPKIKQNMSIPVATTTGINLDDLMNAVKRLKKVPTFDDLLKENQKLKEQLEDMTLCRDIASGHRKEVQDRETILLNQQKEFIEYIASYIELLNDKPDLVELSQKDVLEEILSKYKEIIGGDK